MSEAIEPVAIVYRDGGWWAELFVPAAPGHAWNDNPLLRHQNPPRPDRMDRRGLTLHFTKRAAKRSARRMKERYLAGQTVDITEDVIPVEIVE